MMCPPVENLSGSTPGTIEATATLPDRNSVSIKSQFIPASLPTHPYTGGTPVNAPHPIPEFDV